MVGPKLRPPHAFLCHTQPSHTLPGSLPVGSARPAAMTNPIYAPTGPSSPADIPPYLYSLLASSSRPACLFTRSPSNRLLPHTVEGLPSRTLLTRTLPTQPTRPHQWGDCFQSGGLVCPVSREHSVGMSQYEQHVDTRDGADGAEDHLRQTHTATQDQAGCVK